MKDAVTSVLHAETLVDSSRVASLAAFAWKLKHTFLFCISLFQVDLMLYP